MKQILYIGGGDVFSKYEDFLTYLKTKELDPQKPKLTLWPDSLMGELGDEYQYLLPTMPNTKNAKYIEWKIWFERHLEFLNEGYVLIGWSLGVMFLIKYLIENEISVKPKTLILVAPAVLSEPTAINEGGEDGGDFVFDVTQMSKVATQVDKIYVFHSPDDPIVPYSHSVNFAEAVPAAQLVTLENRGHFVQTVFPELIDVIKKMA